MSAFEAQGFLSKKIESRVWLVYRKLYQIEEKKKITDKEKNQQETFFKQEISEGIYEIKEPYNPDLMKKKTEQPAQKDCELEVIAFDDFFKESEKTQNKKNLSAKEKIDEILGLSPKPKEVKKEPPNPKKEIQNPPKKKIKNKQEEKQDKPEEKPAPPKLSLFKQRMLARRKA